MIIRDVAEATKLARQVVGNPPRFLPKEGRKEGNSWVVRATIGTIDNVDITVRLPENVIGVQYEGVNC